MGSRRGVAGRVAATVAAVAALAAVAMPASSAARGPEGFFGISPAVVPGLADLDQMERAGITTMRFPIFWPIIQAEPRRGRPMSAALAFERYDPVLIEAARRGIRIVPFVYGTPSFLTKHYTTPPLGSPELRREWKLLLQALEDRYGVGGDLWRENPDVEALPIKAFQIWNEPSSASFWEPVRTSPERYAKLLAISDRALGSGGSGGTRGQRAKEPQIIAAGLFGSPTHGMDLPTFLQRFYAVKGVGKHFDVLALHPYAPGLDGVKLQLEIGRDIMKAAGDARKPLWVTEVGWPTDGSPQNPFYKTQEQQATLLRRTFDLFLEKRERWRIRKVIWYTWRDNNVNEACDLCRFSGLFDLDGNPKPAWSEFVEFTGGSP